MIHVFMAMFQRVDKMSVTLLENKSALNEITVAHRTVQGQLEGKTAEMENLLQQNREVQLLGVSFVLLWTLSFLSSSRDSCITFSQYLLFMAIVIVNCLTDCS